MKVYQSPPVNKLNEGGVKRVCEAYQRHLPKFGVSFVDSDEQADLIAGHAGSYPKPTVAHLHGLYWTADYPKIGRDYWSVNADVISAIRCAKEITVPSAWVAETFQRDMRFTPHIIPHGVDWQDWQHEEQNQGFILWNKGRIGDVCDPDVLGGLADIFKEKTFVTTFAPKNMHNKIALGKKDTTEMWNNIKILDTIPHQKMKQVVQKAGVYLSTTKETFGIGVLEAMAAGIPVLGWRYGGNVDLVQHGVNGYLAEPNNITDLAEGLNYCLQYRNLLGQNGQEMARGWTWLRACEMVYDVYKKALEPENHSVSVVIPVYNKTIVQVERAVDSCLNQTLKPKEIIIVNDGSTSGAMKNSQITINWADHSKVIKLISQHNQGVAHARNNGIAQATSTHIACLDSDDWIEPDFLKQGVEALKSDRSLGIAYTGLRWHSSDGSTGLGGFNKSGKGSPWPHQFEADRQLMYPKQNQMPTCCVFRKEVWQRVGGYKQRYAPMGAGSEDAAFWSAIVSIGYNARQVTKKPLFNYTEGGATSQQGYSEIDWLQMYPWGKDKQHPFASLATPRSFSHPVRQYDEPTISVIIPVGPGHEKEVYKALDSLEMQYLRKWEVIIVWDCPISDYRPRAMFEKAYPYAKYIYNLYDDNHKTRTKQKGAGLSRNLGVKKARADLIFFLDADDVLASADTLDIFLEDWQKHQKIIYSDYVVKASWGEEEEARKKLNDPSRFRGYQPKTQQSIIAYQAADYDCALAQVQPQLTSNPKMPYFVWCLVSCLMPKKWFNEAGGFDENLETWEDVELFWRMAKQGFCFHRVRKELILYNADSGHRRELSIPKNDTGRQNHKNLIKYITDKHKEIEIMACGCKDDKKINAATQDNKMNDSDYVEVIFWPRGAEEGQLYGRHLKSPSGQRVRGKLIDYKGYEIRAGDKILVHKDDLAARPDMFTVAPVDVEVPKAKVVTAEPVPITSKAIAESFKAVEETQELEIIPRYRWSEKTIEELYGKKSVKALRDIILNYDPSELDDLEYILEWEKKHKNRKVIINAIGKRQKLS